MSNFDRIGRARSAMTYVHGMIGQALQAKKRLTVDEMLAARINLEAALVELRDLEKELEK